MNESTHPNAAPTDVARQHVRRDGLALPMAIMVLALVATGVVAGFAISATEISTTGSQRAQARAFAAAQMGLEMFMTRRKEPGFCPQCWLANPTSPPNGSGVNPSLDTLPTKAETVTVAVAGGKAFVKAVPVWLDVPTGKGTYYITSTGYDSLSFTAGGKGRTTMATRTVGIFATWSSTTVNVLGALVSFSGIKKNGTGQISGVDECGQKASVPGITVPAQAGVQVNGQFTPTGSPPYDTLKTFAQDSAQTKLDWQGITNGTAMPADWNITSTSSAFPTTGTFASDTNYWPIIHVYNRSASWNSVWTLPNQGRGILIVDGNLYINGSNQWDGIVLVGGQLTSNGNNVTSGTVMAGLNRLIGVPAASLVDADLNGTKSYMYNSCSVKKATSSMARFTMVPNTWTDNVAQY